MKSQDGAKPYAKVFTMSQGFPLVGLSALALCLLISVTGGAFAPVQAIKLPPDETCVKRASAVTVGMTRADVTKFMLMALGINGILKGERWMVSDKDETMPFKVVGQDIPLACTVNIDFRPVGIDDEVYNNQNLFAPWLLNHKHSLPDDFVVKMSAPYLSSEQFYNRK